MKTIRVLLADDHTLVRAGFRSLLQDFPDVEVVAEAANGRDALRLTAEQHPHVVLMDIMMPELNGLDATARLAATMPKVRVIILSMNDTEEYVLQALVAGAAGYLLKDVTPVELEKAIRAVAGGEVFFTSAISKHIVSGYLKQAHGEDNPRDKVTARQREVLQLIAEGSTTKQIAKKLGISVKTAEGHRTELMNALDIHDIAGLVRYAIRTGIIAVEP